MRMVRLQEICGIQIGKTPSRSVPEYWGGELPWATIGDLGRGRVVDTTNESITPAGADRSQSKLVPAGTLLLSFKLSLGKRAFAGRDLYTNEAIAALKVRDPGTTDKGYLYWALGAVDYDRLVDRAAKGKTLNKAKLEVLEVPLPPLSEQKRIAAILDAADELRSKRRESIAQLDTLLQSVFLDMFGDPVTNSKRLPTARLGELGIWRSGGTPSRGRPDYFEGSIPWFSSGELESMVVRESAEYITSAAIEESSAKLVPENSLMLGMYDTAALKASLAGVLCSCNQAVAFAALDETIVDPVYSYYAVTIGREHFRRLQRGVRQKNLNLGMVREIKIPLPARDAQQGFTAAVHVAERHKVRLESHLSQLDTLFASLQSRAFRGDL